MSAIGLPLYIYCHLGTQIVTSPAGLTLRGCRRRELDWSSIILVDTRNPTFAGLATLPMGPIYTVYSSHDKIRFTGYFQDRHGLLDEISAGTGLDWP